MQIYMIIKLRKIINHIIIFFTKNKCNHINKELKFIDYQERCNNYICIKCNKIIYEEN